MHVAAIRGHLFIGRQFDVTGATFHDIALAYCAHLRSICRSRAGRTRTDLDLVQAGRDGERPRPILAREAFITSTQTGSASTLPKAPR